MAKLRTKRGKAKGRGKGPLKGYYAEFYSADRHPKQIRFSLGTKDEQAARAKLLRLERAYANGDFDPWSGDRDIDAVAGRSETVTKAAAEYVESRRSELAESSADTDMYVLRAFERALPPGILVAHVRREHIERYLQAVKNPNTRNSYRERLRGFFRWATDGGMRRGDDPVPPPGKGRQERRQKLARFFSEAELASLVSHLNEDGSPGALDMLDVVLFVAGTGFRRGEICGLRWDAVSIVDRVARVSHTEDSTPKSGRERVVPLVGAALAVVEKRLKSRCDSVPYVFPGVRGGKKSGDYLGKRFRVYRERAGIRDGLTFHGLRHTLGTFAVMRGMDLYRLKEIMGHSNITTTMRYAKLRPVSLRADMEQCFGSGLDDSKGKADEAEALALEVLALRAEIASMREADTDTTGG